MTNLIALDGYANPEVVHLCSPEIAIYLIKNSSIHLLEVWHCKKSIVPAPKAKETTHT